MAMWVYGILLPKLVSDLRFRLSGGGACVGQDNQAANAEENVADVFHDEVHLLLQVICV